MTTTIEFKGDEFGSADEAIQYTEASGRGEAIMLGGKHYVVEKAEAHRLGAAGVPFAYLLVIEHPDHPDGLVVTVPIN